MEKHASKTAMMPVPRWAGGVNALTYVFPKRRCTHLKPISELLLVADDINRLLTPLVDFLQTQPDATVMLRSVLQMDDSSIV